MPFLALALLGFGARETAKRYPMQDDVRALDPAAKTATIAAGKIGDWMRPMTMEYPMKPDSELTKLHVGDHIEAVVVVAASASECLPITRHNAVWKTDLNPPLTGHSG